MAWVSQVISVINRRLSRCWTNNTIDDNIRQCVLFKSSAHTIIVRIPLNITIKSRSCPSRIDHLIEDE